MWIFENTTDDLTSCLSETYFEKDSRNLLISSRQLASHEEVMLRWSHLTTILDILSGLAGFGHCVLDRCDDDLMRTEPLR